MGWINVAKARVHWRVLVNTVTNLGLRKRWGFSGLPDRLSACQRLSCVALHLYYTVFFFSGAAAQRRSIPPYSWGFSITHNDATHLVGLLWTSDKPLAETSIWQYTTLTRDKRLCPRWNSNPQSQQASGRRPTPYTARPLGLAYVVFSATNCAVSNKWSLVTYVPPTCFCLYKVVIREVHTEGYKHKHKYKYTYSCIVWLDIPFYWRWQNWQRLSIKFRIVKYLTDLYFKSV